MENIESLSFLEKIENINMLSEHNLSLGKPNVYIGEYKGRQVIIKFWPKDKTTTSDILESFWLYEIRQLHRLKGCPGLGDYISTIIDSSKDKTGFALVLDVGNRLPLSELFREKATLSLPTWLKKLKDINNRIKLWNNILRVVKAIELLHSQGLLHRHIDEDSILTDPYSSEFDFQLTGFEWSIRVQSLSTDTSSYNLSNNDNKKINSFLHDWNDLGFLILRILKIKNEDISNSYTPIDIVIEKTNLTIPEIILLRGLIGHSKLVSNIPKEAMTGALITDEINKTINNLNTLRTYQRKQYDAIFHLNSNISTPNKSNQKVGLYNAIQETIKNNFDYSISENDYDFCLSFIKDDIGDNPVIASIKKDRSNDNEIVIIGKELSYVIQKNKRNFNDAEPTWDAIFCHSAYTKLPKTGDRNFKSLTLANNSIECYTNLQYKNQTSESNSWEDIINELLNQNSNLVNINDVVLNFSVYHVSEIVYAKSEIYPIKILSYEQDLKDPSTYNIRIACRDDSNDISEKLGLKPSAVRLDDILSKETNEILNWILVSTAYFTEEEQEAIFYFQRESQSNGNKIYEFTSTSSNPQYENNYLIPADIMGTIKQLNRRASAIDELSDHAELINTISDPYASKTSLELSSLFDSSSNDLDESKKVAFKKILTTLPLNIVQGPPGVGKTFLITALTRQIFKEEPESRAIFTAQSHSTVQHLYQEIINSFNTDKEIDPLIVKCIKQTSDSESDNDTTSELDSLAKEYLTKFSQSQVFIDSTSTTAKDKVLSLLNEKSRSGRNSLIRQLLKSANIVFATTNSKQVEELIKARSQFDWSIMEETGKATGIELLSPLLLSYRRLMIGDHKQLPPFGIERIRSILQSPDKLRNALQISGEIYNNALKGEWIKNNITDDYISSLSSDDLTDLGNKTTDIQLLFETFIKNDEKRKKIAEKLVGRKGDNDTISSVLTIQRRMHPDISNVISKVFYDTDLHTAKEVYDFYSDDKVSLPFSFKNNGILNITPSIIWIDIPDVQTTKGFNHRDQYPKWHNTLERNIIFNFLNNLKKSDGFSKSPKLAILSPYSQQVKRLSLLIDKEVTPYGKLANLLDFTKADDQLSFCSTVDGFQGSEADIVVVSLVRNNPNSYSQAALGFLLDSRRINVLLSRAKHKLVCVGSFNFLIDWAYKIDNEEIKKGNVKNKFIKDLIDTLSEYEKSGLMKKINYTHFYNKKHGK